ncbi:MAG: 50S ribosomal protein L16 [Flavobacteriales bacterium]|nr:50S ribosomal protein L16 [Flavobacteriales bacterium]MBP7154878.1 50S ribosomal protein L16 [Flavobacteriales bacterium]HQV74681.1 50S ribosomal protein L16 [Flavobacteriales bacterium]HQW39947.1 50S ribosomal protein L16 [Flavobacteriales bacterium]
MLQPKRSRRRNMHKGRMKGEAQRGHRVALGSFGLKGMESVWLTGRQIESARVALTRYMKRQGQVWIKVFPDKPVTSKPAEVRMGKGKGSLDHWVAVCHAGRIIFEIDGVPMETAKEALRLAAAKLPIPTKFVVREDYDGQ